MTVFRRESSPVYIYDFQMGGKRYTGTTGTEEYQEAVAYEAAVKAASDGRSRFAQAILKRASRELRRTSARGFVYMMQSNYFIKIGHSYAPADRVRTITTSTPDDCELLFAINGGMDLERRLHAEFAASHHRREWFFLCGKLKQFVQDFREQQAALPTVPRDVPQTEGMKTPTI